MFGHIPVLLKEISTFVGLGQSLVIIDATVNGGGHAKEVLKNNPQAKILGIDLDQSALDKLQQELAASGLGQNVTLVHGNFANLKTLAQTKGFERADAILLDLGFSSNQLDQPERGLSFQAKGKLDMRFDQSQTLTAEKVINEYAEKRLREIFKNYGEENFANKIAQEIVRQRQASVFGDTGQVYDVIVEALPKPVKHKAKDVARRIFQAIRIEVNGELENLKKALPQAVDLLKPQGRLMVISFHSLEDRIVKQFFVEMAKGCVCPPDFPQCVCDKSSVLKILTRKPITAQEQETKINPRSNSAKLRVAEKNKIVR